MIDETPSPTPEELAALEAEEAALRAEVAAMTIVFVDRAHERYDQDIRDFCSEHTHPRNMGFLHLPVADDLVLDCGWDEERDILVVTEAEEEDLVGIDIDDLPPDDPLRQLIRPN